MKKKSSIEQAALGTAQIITSYSPESQWANQTPLLYALMLSHARQIMEAFGIRPDTNIRCWFWQILQHQQPGQHYEGKIEEARQKPAPILRGALWYDDQDGHPLSEQEFRDRWPN